MNPTVIGVLASTESLPSGYTPNPEQGKLYTLKNHNLNPAICAPQLLAFTLQYTLNPTDLRVQSAEALVKLYMVASQ